MKEKDVETWDPGLKEEKKEVRSVKPKAQSKVKKSVPEIMPVEKLAEAESVKTWELAGLMRAAGWAPGKQVSRGDFDLTLAGFRKRPQGGGKI